MGAIFFGLSEGSACSVEAATRRSAPAPGLVCPSRQQWCVFTAKCEAVTSGASGWAGLATKPEERGKAGPAAAPGSSVACAVRAPSLLAKHRLSLSRQPPCGGVCALPSDLDTEDREGSHRYFFLCYVIVVSGDREALKARLVWLERGKSVLVRFEGSSPSGE